MKEFCPITHTPHTHTHTHTQYIYIVYIYCYEYGPWGQSNSYFSHKCRLSLSFSLSLSLSLSIYLSIYLLCFMTKRQHNTVQLPYIRCSLARLSGMILSLAYSWAGFDPSFNRLMCLATLKKQSADEFIYQNASIVNAIFLPFCRG